MDAASKMDETLREAEANPLEWHIGANLRWLAQQSDRPARVPCGMLTGQFLLHIADRLEQALAQQPPSGTAEEREAAEERDALLAALGWKTGPFRDAGSRKVILEDSAGLRPEMVKARRRAQDAEGDRDFWRFILGEEVHGTRSGLLLRLWHALKAERRAHLAILARQQPAEGERECQVCKATVAVWDKAMCCHCTEQPWVLRTAKPEEARIEDTEHVGYVDAEVDQRGDFVLVPRGALDELIRYADLMPKATPAPGTCATMHNFSISAGAIWGLDERVTKMKRHMLAAATAPQAGEEG
jgi:hypothetical protein